MIVFPAVAALSAIAAVSDSVVADTARAATGPDRPSLVWVVSDHRVDDARIGEIRGNAAGSNLLLRSTSTLLGVVGRGGGTRGGILAPELMTVTNSDLPYGGNDGAMWAGRGTSLRAAAGAWFAVGDVLAVVLAPEYVVSENRAWVLRQPGYFAPPLPSDRSEFMFPWYQGPWSVDMPMRFGLERRQKVYPGQSSATLRLGPVAVGASTENHWWGPGLQNALILSSNAPGFRHAFLRTASPVATRAGEFDFRWIVGGLEESGYFDTDSDNDLRSLSAIALTWKPPRGGLTVGFARSVWGTASGWGDVGSDWAAAFRATGRPNNRPLNDSSLTPGGYDQLFSLFGRWVLPSAGLELYGEWGRAEFPTSLRDLLTSPNHTQAYTAGLQWVRPGFRDGDLWRLQLENTSVEQSPSFRDRPTGVWYTSRRVIQGYTHEGQVLGAAVGPGSSGQTILIDYRFPASWIGMQLGRTRLNEDVRSVFPFPAYQRWCTHDVNVHGSFRAGAFLPIGLVSVEATTAYRIHPWFQVLSGCPRGDAMIDARNHTLRLTFSPFARR